MRRCEDLGIVAPLNNITHLTPEFTITVELGVDHPNVRLDFNKYGYDGIWIESIECAGGIRVCPKANGVRYKK